MLNLKENKYDINTLKTHIYEINLWDILKTQIINEKFAVCYILNEKYQLTESEQKINIDDVIFHQPHLKKNLLMEYIFLYNSDDDSVPKFDSYK